MCCMTSRANAGKQVEPFSQVGTHLQAQQYQARLIAASEDVFQRRLLTSLYLEVVQGRHVACEEVCGEGASAGGCGGGHKLAGLACIHGLGWCSGNTQGNTQGRLSLNGQSSLGLRSLPSYTHSVLRTKNTCCHATHYSSCQACPCGLSQCAAPCPSAGAHAGSCDFFGAQDGPTHLSEVGEQGEASMFGNTQPGAFPEGIPTSQEAGLVWPEVCGLCGPTGGPHVVVYGVM